MARRIERLNGAAVATITAKGMHADGDGLYLQVTSSGAKSWIFRYTLDGRTRDMGLGPARIVGLKAARERARRWRALRFEGVDPIDRRRSERARSRPQRPSAVSFRQAASAYIATHGAAWRNRKHRDQWTNTLATYAAPEIGDLPIDQITTENVLKVLEPIWSTKAETATRVRMRIEAVLDWAAARGYRRGENPARWKGHLDKLLPSSSKLKRTTHHPALPYGEIAPFMRRLRDRPGTSAASLEFLILTAARTGEVIGARWSEIDLEQAVWTVPADRMKAGRDHRVPLSPAAIALLERLKRDRVGDYVFPSATTGRAMSNMAILVLLRRMKRADITAHGFRSTFRDWTAEQTDAPREVAEMALAHTISNQVEAAYRRGDLFEKRRALMAQWAKFCAGDPA